MSRNNWGADYDPRTAQADDPDDPTFRPPRNRSKRKDRKRWCRGKEGVEHQLTLVLFKNRPCRTWTDHHGSTVWRCFHRYKCESCGKGLGFLKSDDCPDRTVRV